MCGHVTTCESAITPGQPGKWCYPVCNYLTILHKIQFSSHCSCSMFQCCCPGWENIHHRRHREQWGTGARQHGDLWPQHEYVDSPAEPAMPALQTRLCGDQKVHPERLTTSAHSHTPQCTAGIRVKGLLPKLQRLSWVEWSRTPLLDKSTIWKGNVE